MRRSFFDTVSNYYGLIGIFLLLLLFLTLGNAKAQFDIGPIPVDGVVPVGEDQDFNQGPGISGQLPDEITCKAFFDCSKYEDEISCISGAGEPCYWVNGVCESNCPNFPPELCWQLFNTNMCGTEAACLDGIDNGNDGTADCADVDCKDFSPCEYGTELTCNDNFDNDGDTLKDCDDLDCEEDPACFISPPKVESDCSDGEDNNGDGLVDCEEDPSCEGRTEEILCAGVCVNETKTRTCVNGKWTEFTKCPSATAEICDGLDNDCDGGDPDEDFDRDRDYTFDEKECEGVYDESRLDCNDTNDDIYPGAEEICNQIDDDCDGIIDNVDGESTILETKCRCYQGGDPQEEEFNGIDDDCDGLVDENFDVDGDGFIPDTGDCDDFNADVNPDAKEVCINNIDDNCDGATDEEDEGCGYTGNSLGAGDEDTGEADNYDQMLRGRAGMDTNSLLDQQLTGEVERVEVREKRAFSMPVILGFFAGLIILGVVLFLNRDKLGMIMGGHDLSSSGGMHEFVGHALSEGHEPKDIKKRATGEGYSESHVNSSFKEHAGAVERLGGHAAKSGASAGKMKKGQEYVSKMLKQGYSKDQIKTALVDGGWSKTLARRLVS